MMELSQISESLQRDAVWVVFLNVLLQQAGLPVPAVPTLLLAGSLAATPGHFGKILAAAILASVLADWAWYLAGRAFGYRVLAGLCRLSINPGSCVSQTESRFIRWGLGSLVIAKFIPGFSTVAPPIAGALRMRLPGFLLAAATGAGLWAGLALATGWFLQRQVQIVIGIVDRQAGSLLLIVAGIVALGLAWKLWRKYRFRQLSEMPHITTDQLIELMASAPPPLLLDLRGQVMVAETGPLVGATIAEYDRLLDAVGNWPLNQPIITLCACPEDAGAIQAARELLKAGYLSVRPLLGGYDAWLAATNGEGSLLSE